MLRRAPGALAQRCWRFDFCGLCPRSRTVGWKQWHLFFCHAQSHRHATDDPERHGLPLARAFLVLPACWLCHDASVAPQFGAHTSLIVRASSASSPLVILFCELICLAHFSFGLFALFFTGFILLGPQCVFKISVNLEAPGWLSW